MGWATDEEQRQTWDGALAISAHQRDGVIAEGRQRNRRGSVAGLVWANYVPAISGFVTGPLVARGLGPAGRGQVAAVAVFGFVLPVAIALGVPLAIARRAAVEPGSRPALLGSARRFAFYLTPVSTILTILALVGPLASITGWPRVVAAITLGLAPLAVWTTCVQAILVAEGALGTFAWMSALPPVASAVFTVGLIVTGHLGVATYLAANLVSGTPALVIAARYARARSGQSWPLPDLLRFGLRAHGGVLASLANTRLDQLILVPFLGSAALGLYAVSVSLASFPIGVAVAVASRSFGEIGVGDHRAAEAARYLRATMVLAVASCAAVALLAPLGLPLLYGSQFQEAVVPLLLLLPGSACLMVVVTSTTALTVLGRPGLPSLAEGAALVVTVAGLALLLSPLGIVGAAITSTVSYASAALVHLSFLAREGVGPLRPGRVDVRWLTERSAQSARSVWRRCRR